MARVLIAGCGDVGSRAGRLLAAAGHQVLGLRRDVARLPPDLEPVAIDLERPIDPRRLPGAVEVVLYTAAASRHDEAGYRAAYVAGVEHLAAALAQADRPPRRWIFTSSTSVYGQRDGSVVDERSPTEPERYTGRILLAAEARAHAAAPEAAVVRFAGIYGPGRTRLLDSVAGGRATLPAQDPVWTNRIHADDCAAVLARLVELPSLAPIYVGVDDEPAERTTVLRWLAERLGVPAPEREPARPGAHDAGKRCSNALLRQTGFAPRYPTFREGYDALITERGGSSCRTSTSP